MTENTKLMSIGRVSARSGVAISTLHYYESKGLIHSQRNSSNRRIYERSVLRRLATIRIAQQAGLTLAEIKSHLDTLPKHSISIEEWRELTKAWHEMLDQRISALTTLRDHMGGCIGCGCLSLRDCPLRNPEDKLGEQGSGAVLLE